MSIKVSGKSLHRRLQKVRKGTAEKMSLETTAWKLVEGMVQTWCAVVVRSWPEQQRPGIMKGATSFPDQGSYEYDQIRVSLCLLCLVFNSCLGLLRCIELCVFLCRLVFVYSRDIFRVEEFPLQRPDWRVIYCNGLLYVFPTCNIVNFLINFTFLTAT